ncbi:hypothetical protein ACSA002_0410 [Salmonella phage vB_SalM_SA002]|nr:hypothetical protein ACSA002_0410 [Salmonella phage vB_SalM_SA002]
MSAIYLLIVFIPAMLWVILSKFIFRATITLKEWCMQIGALILVSLLFWGFIAMGSLTMSYDSEVLNGYITGKESVRVSCEHQYKCGETCTRDSKGNESCVPIYCDEHPYDVDWDVHSTVGDWTIHRINRQGTREPPRWAQVVIGEPAAKEASARNYMLLQEHHFDTGEAIMQKYEKDIPKYPETYDYYRIDRVINQTKGDYAWMNTYLNDQLRMLGKAKQLNVIVVITNKPYDYYTAVRHAWKGTKRNDVQLFYGLDDTGKIVWFKADSFADGQSNSAMLESLRIPTLDTMLTPDVLNEQLVIIKDKFVRLPNEKLEYLKDQWSPSIGFISFLTILNLIIAIGLSIVMHREDLSEFEFLNKNKRRYY